MSKQTVIRMSNTSFEDMIAESVLKTLNEGFWSGLGKVGSKVGKYAYNRIWKGEGQYDINKFNNDPNSTLKGKIDGWYEKNPNGSMSKTDYDNIINGKSSDNDSQQNTEGSTEK